MLSPPVLQAGRADAVPASSQLWGCGRPGPRAPSSAGHGSVWSGRHHQHTHTHPHHHRHQHLPRYCRCTQAKTHTQTQTDAVIFWYTLLSVRLRGSAPVFLLSAQPHWVSVGQTELCWPPGYWLSWVNTDYRWSVCCDNWSVSRLRSRSQIVCVFVGITGQTKVICWSFSVWLGPNFSSAAFNCKKLFICNCKNI